MVFYSDLSEGNLACVSIFKNNDNNWSFVSKIKCKSEEIYEVNFADINGDESLSEDTVLKDPYPYYLASVDGQDISFSNTAKFIYIGGNPAYLNNIDFNKIIRFYSN